MNRPKLIDPRFVVGSDYFMDSVIVKRPGGTADAEGNPTDALTQVAGLTTAHVHSLEPKRSTQQAGEEAEREASHIDALLVFPAGSDLRPRDLITVSTTGRTYTVATVDQQRLKVRCWVRRIV